MPMYIVTFRCDVGVATAKFEAETPEQALVFARLAYEDAPESLAFAPQDEAPVDEITVWDAKGYPRAEWLHPDRRMQFTSRVLLDAAERVIRCRREGVVIDGAIRALEDAVSQASGAPRRCSRWS